MMELLLVSGVIATLGIAIAISVAATEIVFSTGVGFIVLGMLLGLPASLLYHRQLRRALSSHGALPRRWWLSPVPFHARLSNKERGPVMAWFRVGIALAVLALAGCGMVLLSVLRWR